MSVLEFLFGTDIRRNHDRMSARINSIQQTARNEYQAACSLALALRWKHFPEQDFKLENTTLGVINQIDNMTSQLVRVENLKARTGMRRLGEGSEER